MIGNNATASKTFLNLPSHWSLSVRFDILMFDTLFGDADYLRVYLDSSLQEIYKKTHYYSYSICGSSDYYFVLFRSNMTNHKADSITVAINANSTESTTIRGIAMRNFFLYVDTCDISCATCNGPTNVRSHFYSLFAN